MIGELTNHLWQSTVFAFAAGLSTLAFRRNRAQVRFWLWFGASLKFFVPFSLLLNLGSHLGRTPAATKLAPAVSFAIDQVTQPFSEAFSLAAPAAAGTRDWIPDALLAVWACGFAAIALIRFRSWLRIRAAVRSSAPIDLSARVEIRSCPGLLEPGVVGFLRPILLLPAGIAERLTPAQLEAVLAHELCHIHRQDNLFAGIHMFVEATFWFHPLVWWIGARLIEERERACDEEVLRLGSEPQVYAEGILKVCKLYAESPLVCVSGVTGSDLKKRIEAILTNRDALRLNSAKKAALALAGVAALAAPVVIGILNVPVIRAQTPSAPTPKFEVAAIKLCNGGDPGGMGKSKDGGGVASSSAGRMSMGCMPLADANNLGLIQRAYVRFAGGHLNPPGITPIQGGPAWIHSELYAINAKAEGNPGEGMMQGPMLQELLEDRFKLKIHRETREVPVYALTVAKSGSKLKPFTEGSCTARPLAFPLPALAAGQTYCKAMVSLLQLAMVDAEGATLSEFSKLVGLVFDRPVIDRTGIAGKFDIHLEFGIDEATSKLRPPVRPSDPPVASPDEPARGVSIFTAVQQQLGLKLESAKGPGEFLVIDRVERPSGN